MYCHKFPRKVLVGGKKSGMVHGDISRSTRGCERLPNLQNKRHGVGYVKQKIKGDSQPRGLDHKRRQIRCMPRRPDMHKCLAWRFQALSALGCLQPDLREQADAFRLCARAGSRRFGGYLTSNRAFSLRFQLEKLVHCCCAKKKW